MRLNIFIKAEKLKHLVKLEEETKDKSYFDVDGKKICLANNGKYTYLESCTCTHHSTFGGITDMKMLCSYVLAVYKNKNVYLKRCQRTVV